MSWPKLLLVWSSRSASKLQHKTPHCCHESGHLKRVQILDKMPKKSARFLYFIKKMQSPVFGFAKPLLWVVIFGVLEAKLLTISV